MRLDNSTATNPLNEGADGGMGFGIIMLLVIAAVATLAVTALGAFECRRDQTQRPTEQSLEIEVEPKPDVEPMKQAYPISTKLERIVTVSATKPAPGAPIGIVVRFKPRVGVSWHA